MDYKTTTPNATDEYKSAETEVPQPSENFQSKEVGGELPFKFNIKNVNWRKIIVPGIIVGGILVVYMIFSISSSKKSQDAEMQKVMTQNEAAMVQQPVATPEPKRAVVTMQFGADPGSAQVTQMQADLQQKIDTVMQQATSDKDSITNLGNAIAKTQQDLAAIGQQIEQLTNSVQQILAELAKMEAEKAAAKKVVKRKPPVAYHVRAIVPGRAWLESADGKSVTLRVGDKLEGYGVVRVIAPRQGMVLMSNGSVIQYGINDF